MSLQEEGIVAPARLGGISWRYYRMYDRSRSIVYILDQLLKLRISSTGKVMATRCMMNSISYGIR